MKTSLKLSKLLAENGCKLESKDYWSKCNEKDGWELDSNDMGYEVLIHEGKDMYRAYDIMNDLCIKYAKEVFGAWLACTFCGARHGKEWCDCKRGDMLVYEYHAMRIIWYLQEEQIEEAEEYLWEHCLYNSNNK